MATGTEKNARTYLLRALLCAAVLSIALYALFELRHLIAGPVITIAYPEDGATISGALVEVRGTAHNVTHLTLNDRQVFVDSKGNLREPVLLSEGYNVLLIRAQDRFGRSTQELLKVLVREDSAETTAAKPLHSPAL